MEQSRKELLGKLKLLTPGLASKEIITEMTHFIFTGNNVLTYNDEICVSLPFNTDFQCSVGANDFIDGLNKAKADNVSLAFQEGQLIVRCKDQEFGVWSSVAPEVREQAESVVNEAQGREWKKLPEDFTDGMFLCMFSASRDESDRGFVGIFVHGSSIYSCDNFRASKYTMQGEVDSFLVRSTVAKDLKKFQFVEYNIDETWASFRTGDGVMFNVRQIGTKYPFEDMEDAFLNVEGSRFRLPEEGLKEAASDLIDWSEGVINYHKTIEVRLENNLITCRARKEKGWMLKKIMVEYSREPVTFLISPVFLSEILDKGIRRMNIEEKRASFRKENFIHGMTLQEE